MGLKFIITIDKDMINEYGNPEKDLFVYFNALDKDGKEIEGSTTVAAIMKRQALKAGLEVEATAIWQGKGIRNMENFAKIKIISKEDYNTKK